MSASFIRVWWKRNDPEILHSYELKEGAPPDRGEREMNVLFFGGVQAFQTPGMLSEDVDLQESNSVLREPPGTLGLF